MVIITFSINKIGDIIYPCTKECFVGSFHEDFVAKISSAINIIALAVD